MLDLYFFFVPAASVSIVPIAPPPGAVHADVVIVASSPLLICRTFVLPPHEPVGVYVHTNPGMVLLTLTEVTSIPLPMPFSNTNVAVPAVAETEWSLQFSLISPELHLSGNKFSGLNMPKYDKAPITTRTTSIAQP